VKTDVTARYDDTKEMGKLECLQESYIICHNFIHHKTVEVHEKTAKQGKQTWTNLYFLTKKQKTVIPNILI